MATQSQGTSSQSKTDRDKKWENFRRKANALGNRMGGPVNRLSNKLGAEAFWPSTLNNEADKAARILRSFTVDGFQPQSGNPDKTHNSTGQKLKSGLIKIPPEVIRNAKGLAIFTVMRSGLQWSGAGGSGVIVSRLPNGQWSPPSGILIHTLGYGLVLGVDVYDCVAVINNDKGMDGFTHVRTTIGGEISAAVGPVGGGSTLDSEVFKRQAPVWTYTKSKGFYVGVQIDGTVIVERRSENAAAYGKDGIRHAQILSGQVPAPTGLATQLWETLQAAEGANFDPQQLPPPYEGVPSDHDVEPPRKSSEQEYNAFAHREEHVGDFKT